ncbi:MAG: hypothetical protein HYZ42_02890, partial [Bacteroidetes bacterium]|nr:hypothetical protein [Bacteroidota bacterium]
AGATNSGGIKVGLDTSTAGVKSGNSHLSYVSDGAGSNYKFYGKVTVVIDGTATITGTTVVLKGRNCSGELTLFNNCTLLEGTITNGIFSDFINESVHKEFINE